MSYLGYDTKSHLLELIVKQWETIKCNLNTNIGPCGGLNSHKNIGKQSFKIGAANAKVVFLKLALPFPLQTS